MESSESLASTAFIASTLSVAFAATTPLRLLLDGGPWRTMADHGGPQARHPEANLGAFAEDIADKIFHLALLLVQAFAIAGLAMATLL